MSIAVKPTLTPFLNGLTSLCAARVLTLLPRVVKALPNIVFAIWRGFGRGTEAYRRTKRWGTLTQSEVDDLVFKDADYRIYELTNAAARRDYTKFCEIAAELNKKTGDEIFLLNGLFNYYKNLLTVLSSGESDAQLSKLLKMKEFGVKKSREQAERLGAKTLEKNVDYIYSRIADLKCGRLYPAKRPAFSAKFDFFRAWIKLVARKRFILIN